MYPSFAAIALATVLFPAPAGPSIVTIMPKSQAAAGWKNPREMKRVLFTLAPKLSITASNTYQNREMRSKCRPRLPLVFHLVLRARRWPSSWPHDDRHNFGKRPLAGGVPRRCAGRPAVLPPPLPGAATRLPPSQFDRFP